MRRGLALAVLLPTLGCFAYREPAEVRDALDRRFGAGLEREFGFKAGFLTTKLAGGMLRLASDEPAATRGVSGVSLVVYTVPPGARVPGRPLGDLKLDGWDTVLRVRDADGEALVLARASGGSIRELLFVGEDRDEGEIVVARVRGRLEQLLETTVSDVGSGGGRDAVARATAPTGPPSRERRSSCGR